MKITLIPQKDYNTLSDIQTKFPALTLQNKGYEEINRESLTDTEKEKIEDVENILIDSIKGFDRFQNFRVKPTTGEISIRFQYNYGYDGEGIYYIGVGYLTLNELLNGFN